MFDYFYGAQAEQFAFYRVPKVLFTSDRFKYLSAEAKTLYGILLDRVALSVKNNWIDELGRVYIICTVEEIMEGMNCGNKKAIQLLTELEEKAGLIERKRQGLGKPNLIYVKNFISVDNGMERHFLKCQNDTSGSVKTTSLEVSKSHGNNTDINNTEFSNTQSILSARNVEFRNSESDQTSGCDHDAMRTRESYMNYFRDALEIDVLIQDHPTDEETLLGILDLIVDTCCSTKPMIRIGKEDRPLEVVKSQFMKLTSEHIQYVQKCLMDNTTKVRNIRQYLLTTLYNAPMTISPFYQAWVNNDMYGR